MEQDAWCGVFLVKGVVGGFGEGLHGYGEVVVAPAEMVAVARGRKWIPSLGYNEPLWIRGDVLTCNA